MRKLFFVLSVAFPFAMAQAETVHLKNGEILRGRVEGLSGDVFQLNTKYGLLNVLRDSILTIDFRSDVQQVAIEGVSLSAPAQSAGVSPQDASLQKQYNKAGNESPIIETDKYSSLKIGIDTSGTYNVSGSIGQYNVSIGEDVDSAAAISFEYASPMRKGSSLLGGVGGNFQLPRGFSDSDVTFQFISGYLVGKVKIDDSYIPSITPYLVGQIGAGVGLLHNVDPSVDVSLNGGLYYGLGIELNSSSFGGTMLYSVNKGTLDIADESFDVEYKKLSFLFGYRF